MNTKETLLKSKDLRRSLTPEEAVLWTQLKSHKLNGSKWRKQHPIEPYILDFIAQAQSYVLSLTDKATTLFMVQEKMTSELNS